MKVKSISRYALLLGIVAFILPILNSSLAFAYVGEFGGYTYYGGVGVDKNGKSASGDYISWLQTPDGHSSGYVMPNKQSSYAGYGGDTGQGGAIGMKALGYNGTDNATLKQKLFTLLQNANAGSDPWDKMGSALIVHQMLGEKQTSTGWDEDWAKKGQDARTIAATDWSDLKSRLVDNNKVTMTLDSSYNVIGVKNTAGITYHGQDDAVDYTITSPEPGDPGHEYAWVFKEDGVVQYVLEVNCANPIGDFGGFPAITTTPTYSLTPTASTDKTVVEPGDTVNVTDTVKNTGSGPSDETIWRLTQIVYGPSTTLTTNDKKAGDSASDPCGYFTSSGRNSCKTINESSDENAVFPGGSSKTQPVYNYVVPDDTPVGTKICFTVSVSRPTTAASPVWRHSTLQCIIVSKKPKVQIWGGDVRAGGSIDTSTSTIGGNTYGSWGEYAALAGADGQHPEKGVISGFSSGAGLNKGNPNSDTWNQLTFANTGNPSNCTFGCYDFTLTSPLATDPVVSQFAGTTPNKLTGTVNLNSLASGTYTAKDITLSGTTIDKDKTIIIIATGTVTIAGNIAYNDGPYTNAADIPQVVLQAPTIDITGDVERVDAWLFAVGVDANDKPIGVLNTCSDVAITAALTANDCKNPLVINGPVIVDKIYLRRTGGSGTTDATRGDSAETFNLRADALLWGSNYDAGLGKVRTVYTKELPPRF